MSRRKTKLVAAAAIALSIAGCANLRPGVAAEVGDEKITMDKLDGFADAFCQSGLLAQGGQANTAATTRVASLSFLVRTILADKYADEYADSVPQNQVDSFITASVEPAVAKLPDDEREEFIAEIREFLVATQLAQAAAIAKIQSSGGEVNEQAVGEAVNGLWAEWAEDAGVELDPRFGKWQDVNVTAASGSLSVPAKGESTSTTGPASRPCGS